MDYQAELKKVYKVLGRGRTNDVQLNALCFKLFGNKYNPAGYQDEMAILTAKKPYTIANTSKSTDGDGGIHWVACCYISPEHMAVFDSYGRPNMLDKDGAIDDPPEPKNQQHGKSYTCGQRSVAYLICVDKYGLEEASKI